MDTDTTATETTTGAADAQGNNAPDTTGTAPQDVKTYTQAEIDKMITDRLARERQQAGKTQAELQAELEALRKEKEDRALAELSEIEKAQKAAEEASKKASELEAALHSERVNSLRANLIALEAATLPAAYKAMISGSDEATIKESIAAAQAAFVADRDALLSGITTPEQLATLGEAGKELAEKLGAKGSIGSANTSGETFNVNTGNEDDTSSFASWMNRGKKK